MGQMDLRKPAAGFRDPAVQLITPLRQLAPTAADRIQIPQVVLADQGLALCHGNGIAQQGIHTGSDFAHLIHVSAAQRASSVAAATEA